MATTSISVDETPRLRNLLMLAVERIRAGE